MFLGFFFSFVLRKPVKPYPKQEVSLKKDKLRSDPWDFLVKGPVIN